MRVRSSWWDTWLYKGVTEVEGETEKETKLSVWAEDTPREDSVRRKPSASQEEGSRQKLNTARLWSGLSSFLSCEKRNFCCLKNLICGISLGQPKQIKTFLQTCVLFSYLLPCLPIQGFELVSMMEEVWLFRGIENFLFIHQCGYTPHCEGTLGQTLKGASAIKSLSIRSLMM